MILILKVFSQYDEKCLSSQSNFSDEEIPQVFSGGDAVG
jgi:hypothetical protein